MLGLLIDPSHDINKLSDGFGEVVEHQPSNFDVAGSIVLTFIYSPVRFLRNSPPPRVSAKLFKLEAEHIHVDKK